MKVWSYKGTKPDGGSVSGKFSGTREDLMRELRRSDVVLLALDEHKERLTKHRYALKDFYVDTEQLHYLLVAGMSLDAALKSILKGTRRARARDLWSDVLRRIKGGQPFSEALSASVGTVNFNLPGFYKHLLGVGEETGDLSGALFGILEHLRFSLGVRKEVQTALAYPAFLLFVSLATLAFIASFILPRFSSIYSVDELARLPWVSRIVLGFGQYLNAQGFGFYLALLAFAGGFAWVVWHPVVRRHVLALRWYLPVISDISITLDLANLCASLGSMLKGGVGVGRGLRLSSQIVSCPELRTILDETVLAVKGGQQISREWVKHSLFPEELVSLISVGEMSARLPTVFSDAGVRLMDRFKGRVSVALTFLEPAVVILLGVFIGFIVVAIMLAVVSMSDIYG
jgi:general secretion pathway protein F